MMMMTLYGVVRMSIYTLQYTSPHLELLGLPFYFNLSKRFQAYKHDQFFFIANNGCALCESQTVSHSRQRRSYVNKKKIVFQNYQPWYLYVNTSPNSTMCYVIFKVNDSSNKFC